MPHSYRPKADIQPSDTAWFWLTKREFSIPFIRFYAVTESETETETETEKQAARWCFACLCCQRLMRVVAQPAPQWQRMEGE
ncbi:MAG: hypothetical protein AB2805_11190 [Candidatus Thiodiazotropha sp.]